MVSRRFGHLFLIRTAFTLAVLAGIALPIAQTASATQSGGDSSTNATTMIQVCKAMGGTPVVYSDMSTSHYTIIVECKGGAMDGFNCIFDEGMVSCTQTRLAPIEDVRVINVVSIEPLPEATKDVPEVQVEVPVEEIAPVVEEPIATPTEHPIVDPVIDEPIVKDPLITDGGSAPEPTPEPGVDGGNDPGPGIDIDPSLIEPIVEPVDVFLY